MPALPESALRLLCCPCCRGAFRRRGGAIVCARGHSFDVARQGFVNLLGAAPPANADRADMVEARARFLGKGYYAPLADAIARLGKQTSGATDPHETCILDVGAGPGYYLARVLDACPGFSGIACDISTFAARRAARCHDRVLAVVADAAALPVPSHAVALLMSVFAPRSPAESRRVLHPGGHWLIVTPTPEHLASLREPLGLLAIEPGKDARLLAETTTGFTLVDEQALAMDLALGRDDALALLAMGPSAFHVAAAERAVRVAALAEPIATRVSFTLRLLAPRTSAR